MHNFINYLTNKINYLQKKKTKLSWELSYWKNKKSEEKTFNNSYFRYFYTEFFGFDINNFKNKKILDIGCGPRGSLEWANNASERYGLDPLANSYKKLGAYMQKMNYIQGSCENIPFSDNYFDFVCSFNSLDHVDNLEKSIKEIIRVLKKGGYFMLITDVNHNPTEYEPMSYSFNIIDKFKPDMDLLTEKHFEKLENGIYQSIMANVKYNHKNHKKRYGILTAKMIKK